jgi:hypothetical protein
MHEKKPTFTHTHNIDAYRNASFPYLREYDIHLAVLRDHGDGLCVCVDVNVCVHG